MCHYVIREKMYLTQGKVSGGMAVYVKQGVRLRWCYRLGDMGGSSVQLLSSDLQLAILSYIASVCASQNSWRFEHLLESEFQDPTLINGK